MGKLASLTDGQVIAGSEQFIVPDPTAGWIKIIDFEGTDYGDSATGGLSDEGIGFDTGGELSVIASATDPVFSGTRSCRVECQESHFNTPLWGGYINLPTMRQGEQVWVRIRTFMPAGFDPWALPGLKFLRFRTDDENGDGVGHNDVYWNKWGNDKPFYLVNEPAAPSYQHTIGEKGIDTPVHDVWETYEFSVVFDTAPVDSDGLAITRFWKNGRLIGTNRDERTMQVSTDYCRQFLLFTYWNGNDFNGPDSPYDEHPPPVPPQQHMFVDEIRFQTQRPSAQDAHGNYYIGMD